MAKPFLAIVPVLHLKAVESQKFLLVSGVDQNIDQKWVNRRNHKFYYRDFLLLNWKVGSAFH